MKDNAGFTNWETERMYQRAIEHFDMRVASQGNHPSRRDLLEFERFVGALRQYEPLIKKEGFKTFTLYLEDSINYWEVYGRVTQRVLSQVRN